MTGEPQFAIRGRCRHPSARFEPFAIADVEQSVPERFEQQVDRHAERIAIRTAAETLTYANLDRLANRIAHAILARAGGDREPVAVLFEHEAAGIAALLGVLKAGRCYVPLDPASPVARTALLLEDAGARVIVTHGRCRALAERLAGSGAAVLDVDALDGSAPSERLGLRISPDALASMYYTSGSTGRPKGVVEIHRHRLVNARRSVNALGITPDDRLVLLYTVGFSGSANDVFGALLSGARLCPFDLRAGGADALARWLRDEAITIYHSTPQVLRSLLDALPVGAELAALRAVLLHSDSLYPADVERFRRHFGPTCLLLNAWGVTESSFFRPYFIDPRGAVPDGAVPAIGPPEEDDEIRLLDDDGGSVAPGETGEIVVTSRYLSPGYWGREGLTRERFRAVDGSGVGAYFTGDLGRALPDGSIAHLGRKDFQTKVRGYRVEPAEVEGALRALPGVRQAAVMGQPDGQGGHRLIAYVVMGEAGDGGTARTVSPAVDGTASGAAVTASAGDLRRALRERLPDYLVPSRVVLLPALPLTASGKLDRLALPAPGRDRPALDRAFRAAVTPLERALAGIWGAVLGLDGIGVDDDFLELGGDSLLAMQVTARVRETCGVDVPVEALLEAPTVAQMALTVAVHGAGPSPGAVAPFVGETPAAEAATSVPE